MQFAQRAFRLAGPRGENGDLNIDDVLSEEGLRPTLLANVRRLTPVFRHMLQQIVHLDLQVVPSGKMHRLIVLMIAALWLKVLSTFPPWLPLQIFISHSLRFQTLILALSLHGPFA